MDSPQTAKMAGHTVLDWSHKAVALGITAKDIKFVESVHLNLLFSILVSDHVRLLTK